MKTVPIVLAAAVLVLGTHALTAADEPKPAATLALWEYKQLDPGGREDLYANQETLNVLGKQGWELVLIERGGKLWFKRPLK